MKYCCDNFEYRVNAESSMGLNIRIIKVSDKFVARSSSIGFPIKKDNFYKYIITQGYEGKLIDEGVYSFINYCPYCGKKLSKFYSKDKFINEDNHVW